MSEMIVTVMSKDSGYHVTIKGNLRIYKNNKKDEWFIYEDVKEQDVSLDNLHRFPVKDFYLIVN